MPRPKQCRRVCLSPECTYFKPAGVPANALEEVVIAVDELEALRLADLEGIYHERAARLMGVSRRTFGRIVEAARKKVAEALIRGMALRIEGGVIEMAEMRTFQCDGCGHQWQVPFGTGRPSQCPQCQGKTFRRAEEERGRGGRRRGVRGQPAAASADNVGTETDAVATEVARGGRGRRQRRRQRRGASD
jgi:predicted DNA-binding protein (UPF0251 family)